MFSQSMADRCAVFSQSIADRCPVFSQCMADSCPVFSQSMADRCPVYGLGSGSFRTREMSGGGPVGHFGKHCFI